MVSRELLAATGCTPERLRAIFTCKDFASDTGKIRKKFQDRAQSRIQDGMATCLKNAHLWQAVDIAWDSTPIQKQTIPLLLFAQGKIQATEFIDQIKDTDAGKKCLKKAKDGTIKVDAVRLYEISINLIRSYVTRRLAAQTARFSNLWPYFKYEPFGTDEVAKLRGEVLSQRIDVMVNAYNYRHIFPQSYRHIFLYSRALMFPRSAWDVKTGWKVKEGNTPVDPQAEPPLDSYVEREGVDFALVHPSRYYWDRSAPLPNINKDIGPKYIGYWDIVPFGAIKDGEGYYNTDAVCTTDAQCGLVTGNGCYFQYYYDPKVLQFPERSSMANDNDRRVNLGFYSAEERDRGVVVAQHFECINPKHEGIGKLNAEVWLRMSVAGDGTVVAAEFMPSIPAVYGGMNENDDRLVNNSMAMELMPFQDQLTNIFSQMLMNLRTGMMQIWAIDKDALDDDMQKYIKDTLEAGDYYVNPQAWFYSGSKVQETGFTGPNDARRPLLSVIQAKIQTTINDSMKAVGEVLNMADRILVLSPNEIGQPNPREVSAREVTEISTTTNSISSFISDGIDEQREAVKKLLFESLVCMSTQNFRVPAISRYNYATVRKAGFDVPDFTKPDGMTDEHAIIPIKSTIVGRIKDLLYDYYFDSRDGGERPVNSQSAAALSQLLGQVMQVPEFAQAVGRKRAFEMLSEIFRLSGSGYTLLLEDGESEGIPQPGATPPTAPTSGVDPLTEQRIGQLEGMLKQLLEAQGVAPPAEGGGAVPPSLTAA